MPHVTFIHGISNKPPADDLLRIWREALADAAEPLPLGDLGVTSSMVYWADLLYEKPDEDLAALRGRAREHRRGDRRRRRRAAAAAAHAGGGGVPRRACRAKMTALPEAELATAEPPPVPAQPQGTLERVPLPWFLKKRFMNAFLRDVHHYLFDVEFAPPGAHAGAHPADDPQALRRRARRPRVSRPHVVVSHSMGTVIAYDCLKRVGGLRGRRRPHHASAARSASTRSRTSCSRAGPVRTASRPRRSTGGWVNLFDRLDPVCGFDPLLANDYRRAARHRRRGHRGAERRRLAALGHQVPAPAGASAPRCGACSTSEGQPWPSTIDLDELRERARRRAAASLRGCAEATTSPRRRGSSRSCATPASTSAWAGSPKR